MKRLTFVLVSVLLALILSGCPGTGQDLDPVTYSLRDTGPAGGLVFYDKGSYSDGWRYLEAASEDVDSGNIKEWGGRGYKITGTGTAVGAGNVNTSIIVSFHDGLSPDYYTNNFDNNISFTNPTCTFDSSNDGTVAAKLCTDYSVINNGTTYSDWFLPSKDELNKIYLELTVNGLGGLSGSNYWSSSESTDNYGYSQNFANGDYNPSNSKSSSLLVRAIRAF